MKRLIIPLLLVLLMPLTSCATPDISPKMEKLTESARQGDVYDQLLLGYKYYNGLDVPQDFKKALKWYRKAAEQGAVDAQIYLGTMYHNGEGTDVDYVQAYMWFDLAAQQGHQRGEELRGLISEKMGPDDIAKAQKMTEKYDFKQ